MGNARERLDKKNKKKKKTQETNTQFLQNNKEQEGSGKNNVIEKKKRKRENRIIIEASDVVQITRDEPVKTTRMKINSTKKKKKISEEQNVKMKRTNKRKGKNEETSMEGKKMPEMREEADQNEVYCISSGDEDASKGMKKWVVEYNQKRTGLKFLQQRIDDFITAHEENLEQEKKEREAFMAEEGWTVVTHHKGRKKTTDDSGLTVGSVAPIVAQEQLANKKSIIAPHFYRFQRREAQRNEILELQSKFEQDKKRIQQLRAARKFKPY